ncbi:hypothetical protein LCGC14_2766330, partial [marine sediment metagenome]
MEWEISVMDRQLGYATRLRRKALMMPASWS